MRIFRFKKPKFLLGLPIALFSLQTYLGTLLGYFAFKFFSGKFPSLAFNIGNYRLHLHHWLCSLVILVLDLNYNFLPFSQFSFGFLVGAAFQGIYCYQDWHKILMRKKEY